ncbi:MAG TPA: DUF6056 family protein [Gammaproteobacteria bacterium]|nr:DUF6056 family protein [Gammaproteobacteria bacterium]
MSQSSLIKLTSYILFLAIFCYFLIINRLTPLASDDFLAIPNFSSFSDLIGLIYSGIKASYLHWGGRVSLVFVINLFLRLIPIFNFLNAIMFCCFIYGIFLNALLRPLYKIRDLFTILFIVFVLWFFIPELGESAFWKTGAIVYLWPLTGALYFIYPFLVLLLKNNDIVAGKYGRVILLVIGALLLGMSHEDLAVPVGFLLLLTISCCHFRNKDIPTWSLVATALFFISFLILIIAPGNYVRAAHGAVHDGLIHKTLQLSFVIYKHYISFNGSQPLFLLTLAALFILLLQKFLNSKVWVTLLLGVTLLATFLLITPNWIKPNLISTGLFLSLFTIFILLNLLNPSPNGKRCALFILLSGIAAYATIVAPWIMFGYRMAFFADIFFVIAMLSVICNENSLKGWNVYYPIFCLSLLFFLVPSMIHNYKETKFIYEQEVNRENLMSLYQQNNTPIILQPLIKNQLNLPNKDLLLYTPHLVVRDFNEHELALLYHSPIILRPFVERWSTLEKVMDVDQAKTHFSTLVINRTFYYVTTRSACAAIENKNPFFLHVYPKDSNNLAKSKRANGFEDLGFAWQPDNMTTVISDQGKTKSDVCVFAAHLPYYPIKQIVTGQYSTIDGKTIFDWTSEFLSYI